MAAPGRAANLDHDTNKHTNYAAFKGIFFKASPKSTEGVTIKTDFTVEGELSKNFAGEGDYARTAIADNGRPEAITKAHP
jgi:hypothetical protein